LGGYKFEGRRGFDAPRLQEYTFYIAAKDNSGNYSEPNEITLYHQGIRQLDTPVVNEYFQSLEIMLPAVYKINDIEGNTVTGEFKEILGYVVRLNQINGDGSKEEKLPIDEYENSKIINVPSGTEWEITVGAYDSVINEEYNTTLYENTFSEPIIAKTTTIKAPDINESLLSPNELTKTLSGEGLPDNREDFNNDVEEEHTFLAGYWEEGASNPTIGGLGLKYDSNNSNVDIQMVANQMRLFPESVDDNDVPLFAVGEPETGEKQIFMNADTIAMFQGLDNLDSLPAPDKDTSSFDNKFLLLNDDGFSVFTQDFRLNANGSAYFAGEVNASRFALISDTMNLTIDDENGISSDEFEIDSSGNATFSGNLSAASGTFSGSLDAASGTFSGSLEAVDGTFSGDLDVNKGTISTSNLVLASQNGTTFNLSGNDLVIDTNQFTLDEEGNGTFRGELEAASGTFEGDVIISDSDNNTLAKVTEKEFDEGETGIMEFYPPHTNNPTLDIKGYSAVESWGDLAGEIKINEPQEQERLVQLYGYYSSANDIWDGRLTLDRDLPGRGIIMRAAFHGAGGASFYMTDSSGDITISKNGEQGSIDCEELNAATKNFTIRHPDKDEYYLKHSAVETPTAGDNIYRYNINISNDELKKVIELPDYFNSLNKNEQIFVVPVGHFGSAYGEIEKNKLTVISEKKGEYNVLIIGTRKDKDANENWNGAEIHYSKMLDYDTAYERNNSRG